MATRSWTELFFLDEATAFAAGHRPCFYCRREDANAFRGAWEEGNGVPHASAPEIDAVLHRERLDGKAKRLHALPMPIEKLPDGVMVRAGGESYLIVPATSSAVSTASLATSITPACTILPLSRASNSSGTFELRHSIATCWIELESMAGKISSYCRHSLPSVCFQSVLALMP